MASLARSCRRASYDGSDRKRSGDAALVVAGLRASISTSRSPSSAGLIKAHAEPPPNRRT